MLITKIEQHPKHKDMVTVVTDETAFDINKEICITERLYAGKKIDEQELSRVITESNKKTAFLKGLNYVSKKICPEKKVKDYLFSKGYNEDITQETIQKLKEYRYIDDREYAKSYLQAYSANKGKQRIVYELKNKGIPEDVIRELDFNGEREFDNCLRLAEKFIKNKEIKDIKTKQKLYNHLLYKGYGHTTAQSVLSKLCGNDFSEGEI